MLRSGHLCGMLQFKPSDVSSKAGPPGSPSAALDDPSCSCVSIETTMWPFFARGRLNEPLRQPQARQHPYRDEFDVIANGGPGVPQSTPDHGTELDDDTRCNDPKADPLEMRKEVEAEKEEGKGQEKCVAAINVGFESAGEASGTPLLPGEEDMLPEGSRYRPWLVPLWRLHFYQDFIGSTFTTGRPLSETVEELKTGVSTPESLPPIEALFHRGVWYGMGNRRLACFNMAYRSTEPRRLIPVLASHIPSDEELLHQGTGRSVRIGHGMIVNGLFTMQYSLPRD